MHVIFPTFILKVVPIAPSITFIGIVTLGAGNPTVVYVLHFYNPRKLICDWTPLGVYRRYADDVLRIFDPNQQEDMEVESSASYYINNSNGFISTDGEDAMSIDD